MILLYRTGLRTSIDFRRGNVNESANTHVVNGLNHRGCSLRMNSQVVGGTFKGIRDGCRSGEVNDHARIHEYFRQRSDVVYVS